jgi:hypothetical protein
MKTHRIRMMMLLLLAGITAFAASSGKAADAALPEITFYVH